MYEITSCQISNGNEDDKVVPYIDYNYSFFPVLSSFPIMFMGRGRVRSYSKKWCFQHKGENTYESMVFLLRNLFILQLVLFLLNESCFPMEFFSTTLINKKDSVAATGSCNHKVCSQSVMCRQSVWLTKQASSVGLTVTAAADGLPRNEVVYIDLPERCV